MREGGREVGREGGEGGRGGGAYLVDCVEASRKGRS